MNEAVVTVSLYQPQQAHATLTGTVWPYLKSLLMAGHRLTLTVRPETRSDAQNRLLHARIGDVAKHCTWAGKKWNTDEWKRLLTAAWCRTRNEGVEIVPAIDGKGFDVLYQRTSKLSRAECVDLSDFILAWGSQQEPPVRWSPTSLGGEQ